MKAFISYSHRDQGMLDRLHIHLAQLKRDGQLDAWSDEAIGAGNRFDQVISYNLKSSQLFLALLSPDYIASNYCYDKEFAHAQELEKEGKLSIVPIILEPCDWSSTPFNAFKALPKDGKPISEWSNANTAFLDVIQNLKNLLAANTSTDDSKADTTIISTSTPSRNYKIKKDFDSIQKIEFAETAFSEIKTKLELYLKEIFSVDPNIKHRILKNDANEFEAILVNRNKINMECTLKMMNDSEVRVRRQSNNYNTRAGKGDIVYTLGSDQNNTAKGFEISNDEYQLFWTDSSIFYSARDRKQFTTKDMADTIWSEWLEIIGIM